MARAPALRMTVVSHRPRGEAPYHVLTAYQGRKAVGHMELEPTKAGKSGILRVAFAEVETPGQGIGTKMYERAARFACSKGMPLGSDKLRTKYSEGFWKKQASKGRATCVVRRGGVALSTDFYEKGRRSCGHYALTCPAPRSLKGVGAWWSSDDDNAKTALATPHAHRAQPSGSTPSRSGVRAKKLPWCVYVGENKLGCFERHSVAKSDMEFINRQHARRGLPENARLVEELAGLRHRKRPARKR